MNKEEKSREKIIVRTSVIGIIANCALAGFKVVIGLLTNSIAILLDAVNNLSDALSSVITIVGTKLARKPADKKHPLGYGRIEYLTAAIISLIVLYAGITSLEESVKKIFDPQKAEYTAVSLVIVAAAVLVKLVLGSYVKKKGVETNSDSLVNSGQDATLDAVISASTLLAAAVYIFCHISLEAWLGALISLVIIKAGFEMLRDTISQILGERVDPAVTTAVKSTLKSMDGVYGAYDLILHAYGPDNYQGSVHIEVPDVYTADQIDRLARKCAEKVYSETGVYLTGIGIYSMNTHDDEIKAMEEKIRGIATGVDYVKQLHGFYYNEESKDLRFDVVVEFAAKDRRVVYEQVHDRVLEAYPDVKLSFNIDLDISD